MSLYIWVANVWYLQYKLYIIEYDTNWSFSLQGSGSCDGSWCMPYLLNVSKEEHALTFILEGVHL